jgi:hypothetical protein
MPDAKSVDETRARALTYKLQRLSDYSVIPSTERLIDPYLPLGGQIVLAALPKTFKTYVGLSWACCVATGHKWLGHPVKKGKVLYGAFESYHGVLRRKEAWRKHHGYSKEDLDNLVCITAPINLAHEGSIDTALRDLSTQGFRPDFIVLDTWFKSTAGAKVSDQAEMTAALDRLTVFQKKLEEVTEFKDSLPQVTVLILAHTDKKGIDLFGSIAQFANCDALYMLNRQEHALVVTLSCTAARDIEEPADLTITLENVIIETANGPEENLAVVSGAASVGKKSKKQDDLANMETVLEITLQNRGTRTQWLTAMQNFGRGWSEANFDKKVGVLKSQKRLTGGGAQGEYYSVSYTPEAQRARGQVVKEEGQGTSKDETTLRQKYPHTHPLKGDEGCEGSFLSPHEPSNSPQKGNEGSSNESRNEENSIEKDEQRP